MKLKSFILFGIIIVGSVVLIFKDFWGQSKSNTSEDLALKYLRNVQDQFHKTFDVYTDHDNAGNHFTPSGWMTDDRYDPAEQFELRSDWLIEPYSGMTCLKITHTYSKGQAPWAGIYWLYPDTNWANVPNAGYNLSGAKSLEFCAKGEKGGEWVEFFAFGVGWNPPKPYRDSSNRVPPIFRGFKRLTDSWEKYSIDLKNVDLSYIIGGFAFVVDPQKNGYNNVTFYLDDIYYVLNDSTQKARLEKPHFLLSYSAGTDSTNFKKDFTIRNAAFVEDNAKAMLAFMDTTNLQSEDWNRAKLIGDAFVLSQNSDRSFNDNRLRNGYMAGDLHDHFTGVTRIPNWWDFNLNENFENEFAAGSYTGNMAWIIISWLHYHKWKPDSSYYNAAIKLGNWIRDRYDSFSGDGGYYGGFEGFEEKQIEIFWKSIEHNILVYAAFYRLLNATNDSTWYESAIGAREWVETLWDINGNFLVHQTNIHALASIFLGGFYSPGLAWVENNAMVTNCPLGDTLKGFDFDDDLDGIWYEGTAQMVQAYIYQAIREDSNRNETKASEYRGKAQKYLSELERAQINTRFENSLGSVEACHDSVSTGILDMNGNPLYKNKRLHIGTTSWYIIANPNTSGILLDDVKSGLNSPFTASYALGQNYPNPFNQNTQISYNLPKTSHVILKIYNILGQVIYTLVQEKQHAGNYSINWGGKDDFKMNVSSGVYICRIIADNYVETRKMLLMR